MTTFELNSKQARATRSAFQGIFAPNWVPLLPAAMSRWAGLTGSVEFSGLLEFGPRLLGFVSETLVCRRAAVPVALGRPPNRRASQSAAPANSSSGPRKGYDNSSLRSHAGASCISAAKAPAVLTSR